MKANRLVIFSIIKRTKTFYLLLRTCALNVKISTTTTKHDKHSSMNVLTRKNINIWFDDFKLYFEKKKLWNIINKEFFTLDTSTSINVSTSFVLKANNVFLTSMYFIKFYDDCLKNYHKSNVKIKSKIIIIVIIKNYETFRDDDTKIVNYAKTW